MEQFYPHTYEYMYKMCREGNESLSELTHIELKDAAIRFLQDSDDGCDFPDDMNQQLSKLLVHNNIEVFKDIFLPELFSVNKTVMDDIFEEALREYRRDRRNGKHCANPTDYDDWKDLDSKERCRGII